MLELNKLYNMDCMEGMAQFPDNYFDLAIVDPPYGIGDFNVSKSRSKLSKGYKVPSTQKYDKIEWNDNIPTKEYFDELFRVSKHYILFGFQHYLQYLNSNSGGVIIHDFISGGFLSHADLALTDLQKRVTIFRYLWSGFLKNNSEITDKKRIHPCEKPVALYKWLLKNYAKPDFKIIDTHAGSCSSVISFIDFGCDWIAFELDKDYYEAASKRIENHKLQLKLF